MSTDTSLEAYASILKHASRLARQVFRHIAAQPDGATCDECEVALDMAHQTCSARIRELKDKRLLRDSGKRRLTRSGRRAMVLVLPRPEVAWHSHNNPRDWIHTEVNGRIRTTCAICGGFIGWRDKDVQAPGKADGLAADDSTPRPQGRRTRRKAKVPGQRTL